ncbi:MAG: (d)CMP kinase [Gammaproteobacteria bacterium]|nr:(d)CMP kinase [Gammaproteobacteria bacterium]
MSDHDPVITIDGPSGTGKGTVGLLLAHKLGWHILDSGAFYRAFAHIAHEKQILPDQIDQLQRVGDQLDVQFEVKTDEIRIWVGGRDITGAIRSEEGGRFASIYAAIPEVRQALLARQRETRRPPGLVADGRDLGSVVFPDAVLKIFLTATPKVRAERRYKQLKDKGFDVNLPRLEKEIAARDYQDTHRTISPLMPASDAVEIDTSEITREQVLDEIVTLLGARQY